MKTIKAILFDHDGTLVDSENTHYEMWASILISFGISLTVEDYINRYVGIPTTTNAVKIIEKYALKISPSVLIESKNAATKSFLSKHAFPLSKGARESIDYFSQKDIKLAIVTGAGIEGVDATILANNFQDKFQTIVCGDDVENSKPAPDCYLLAMQRLGVNAAECIAIEDSKNGVTAAVLAGITCIALSTPMSKCQDLSQSIKTFDDLNKARKWILENYIFH